MGILIWSELMIVPSSEHGFRPPATYTCGSLPTLFIDCPFHFLLWLGRLGISLDGNGDVLSRGFGNRRCHLAGFGLSESI